MYFADGPPSAAANLGPKVAAAFERMDPPWSIGSYGWGAVTYERYLQRTEALTAEHGVGEDVVEHGLIIGYW